MVSPPPVVETAAALREMLPNGGPLLALDLGTKTIGVASCDAGWRFATPGKTLARGKFGRDREALAEVGHNRGAKAVVIGLPRNMDGSEGPRAQSARAYARNVADALGLPVLLWDERWSTASAEAAMIGQGPNMPRRQFPPS